jgi:hypothetical protein
MVFNHRAANYDCGMNRPLRLIVLVALLAPPGEAAEPDPGRLAIEPRLVHLRNDQAREWSSFPERPEVERLEVRFAAEPNRGEYALRLRQQDVKQTWRVLLNDKPLGDLVREEADLAIYLPIPTGALAAGENTLRIESPARGARLSDDIRVGEIWIEPRPVADVLAEATLEIEVVDADSNLPLPARITIVNERGARQAASAEKSERLAVRPGVVYTADGKARVGIPAGDYTIYAGRGFEYSLVKAQTTAIAGQTAKLKLAIRREVPTPGYVACDTHIHTVTFSGHGDASIAERMVTLAGEAVELPIATDHNIHIDYEEHARRIGVRQHFTPVIGNEVTTPVGHFNVFPIQPGARLPNHRLKEWGAIFDEIFATPGIKVAILNHARDVHSGVRPFGPERFNAATGDNLAGWPMRMTAMEVINSGATQTDPLRLVHDWMAVLNHGYQVTPVGSSDSHDVARYIVGQGRTYIRGDDRDVSRLDVDTLVANFLEGKVLVSYGLLAELTVGGDSRSGELAKASGDEVEVAVRVLGPHWTEATRVQLYANGQLVREEAIQARSQSDLPGGVQWQGQWRLPRPKHDVHLVAVALGKGVDGLFWQTAKPYQPTSPDWMPYTLGVSGAVWLDADADGRRMSARDYAERAFKTASGDLEQLVASLKPLDAAIAAQGAHLYRTSGQPLDGEAFEKAMKSAPPQVAAGFAACKRGWRDHELAGGNH